MYERYRGFPRAGGMRACVLLVLLVASAGAETPEARALLRQVQAAFEERPPVAFEANAVAMLQYEGGPVHRTSFTESFRQDRDRLDVYLLQSQSRGTGAEAVDLGTLESRSIWDGSGFINRTTEPGGGDVAYFTRDRSYRDSTRIHDSQCACLDGLLPLEGHFAALMLKSGALAVQPEREQVGDASCYVVEARGSYGRLRAWLDPACGYHFRKLVLWGPAADSGEGGASAAAGPSLVVENVALEQIGGRWLAVSGTVQERGVVKSGQGYEARRTMARSNVVWNPDFETLGAFRMDLPEGAYIRHKEAPGVPYRWYAGRMVLDVDSSAVAVIDSHIALLTNAPKALRPAETNTVPPAQEPVTESPGQPTEHREESWRAIYPHLADVGGCRPRYVRWLIGASLVIVVTGAGWLAWNRRERSDAHA